MDLFQKGEEILEVNFYVVFTNLRKPTSMQSNLLIQQAYTKHLLLMYQLLFQEPGIHQGTNIPILVDGNQQQIVYIKNKWIIWHDDKYYRKK